MGNDLKYGLVLGVVVLLIFVGYMTIRDPAERGAEPLLSEEPAAPDEDFDMFARPAAPPTSVTPVSQAPPAAVATVEIRRPPLDEIEADDAASTQAQAPVTTTTAAPPTTVVRPTITSDVPDISLTLPSLDRSSEAPAAPPAVSRETTYTIQPGDQLMGISKKFYGTTKRWREIADANPGVDPNRLVVGEEITIPAAASEAPEAASPTAVAPPSVGRTHTVARGDTLYGIAEEYYGDGGQWRKIYEANRDKLSSPEALKVGMNLSVP